MILVVVESHFGNTVALAEAMAAALRNAGCHTEVWMAHEAPDSLPTGVRTLLVGAPTHEGSLSTPATRKRAAGIGAKDSTDTQGVREWLAGPVPGPGVDLVLFDTVRAEDAGGRSAADRAAELAPPGRYASVERGPSFSVEGIAGPLSPGELRRARRWALQELTT